MVDVEGFEGPLDLLLTLARQQKVDLAKISILALADQYLAFIEAARKMRLELAADYLVMAAWLAYLKSRLLLPEAHPAEGVERRGHGECAGAAPAAPRGHPEICRANDQSAAARPRRFPARPAGADRRDQAAAMVGDAIRPALGLCRAAADPGEVLRAHAQAHGVVARRSARGARTAGRPVVGLEPARPISHRLSGRPVARGRRCSLRALPRCSNWCAKASSKCISKARSRRSTCASGRARNGAAIRAEDKAAGAMAAESGNG